MVHPSQIKRFIAFFIGLGLIMFVKIGMDLKKAIAAPMIQTRQACPPAQGIGVGIETRIRELSTEEGIDSEITPEGAVIKIEETLLYQSGKADIQPRALPILNRIIDLAWETPGRIRVEGHTDNVPITYAHDYRSNYELSMARAMNVAAHFVDQGGLSSERISAVGYGEAKPIMSNDTPENRARNRRVEITILMNGETCE